MSLEHKLGLVRKEGLTLMAEVLNIAVQVHDDEDDDDDADDAYVTSSYCQLTCVFGQIQNKLATMKRIIATTQNLEQALGQAQILRNMKPVPLSWRSPLSFVVLTEGCASLQGVDQIKALLPPLPKPSPPLLQKTDDKLTAVKKTVNVALFDLEKTLTAAQNTLLSAQVISSLFTRYQFLVDSSCVWMAQDPRVVVQLVKISKSLVTVVAAVWCLMQ
jgi:hypothetical protein